MVKNISVRGAKMHNLKNLDVEIPREKLTVVTGVSGSGKSSLAFDTIYAEGQRRYVESLSTYARQFLKLQEKPEVDSIDGLSPAISIDQKSAPRNPRSTVGTVTEVYDFLRLLFAKIGEPVNPHNGRPLQSQSPGQILDAIDRWEIDEKFMILSPMVRGKKGEHSAVLEKIKKAGFVRIRIDAEVMTLNDDISLDPNKKHTIEIVVDRLVKKDFSKKFQTLESGQKIEEKNDERMRVIDSIETALKFGEGVLIAHRIGDEKDFLFSENLADPETGFSFPPIEPRIFSFNSPHGACESCHGLGYRLELNHETAINPKLSIREGGILPWVSMGSNALGWYLSLLEAVGERYNFSIDRPIGEIPADVLVKLFSGFGEETFEVKLRGAFRGRRTMSKFEGIAVQTEKRYNETDSDFLRKKLGEFMIEATCKNCGGARLNIFGRNVFIHGKAISQISSLSVSHVRDWISKVELTPENEKIVQPIQKEISDRLGFLKNVGLSYLTLSRAANTLSGGEAQRIRLATQIGSQLQGVLYVLDEPSIGLHQRDNGKLITTLKHLRDIGNTVIVVEHDEETMRDADHVIEIGPLSGAHGGELVFAGTLEKMKNVRSETADFLFGRQKIHVPRIRRRPTGWLEIFGARENNLKNIDAKIPVGCFVGISGVSGSGKSSLINRILVPVLARELNHAKKPAGLHDDISGIEQLDKLISIDQSPIGRTPRSNPATYTGVFTDIREVFAATTEARLRGYTSSRFSFNVKGGRCEACSGDGIKKIEMHFLPDVYVPCEVCAGRRYNDETLEVTYRGKTISDVLEMTIEESVIFFENFGAITSKLKAIEEVGLGYMKLGQSATTLSGGEAQRVKLASELMKKSTGSTMYILDEPTTGLHFSDVKKLLAVLQQLVDKGNSVIVIEHNLDVLKCCDHLIDMGPDGGDDGGTILCAGTPEEVSNFEKSYTGEFLKKMLEKEKKEIDKN
ncbi:excinuclease ABC subunit UvrA [bacterium]|jgi:excinuclease ABC subunit A|nr:excinuclease ABC subunit UvrA [bacterium]MBT6831813.1 excinuclease ABC subunit UvrA [bacterium]MBT6996740.1 excinuclease ABC subunit UvrA [bacterium]MBT7772188.1 excinuclease ABC subunit UvrA [bacterium]